MSESSAPVSETARKSLSLLLRRLAATGQAAVADTLGRSETWISRWKADDAEAAIRVIDACGLKLVPVGARCFSAEHIEHLRYFAGRALAAEATPTELTWDDE